MKASLLYLVMSYAVLTLAAPQKVGHKGGQKVSQSVGQKSGRNSLHGGEKNQKNGQNGGRHINYGPLAKNNIPCSKRDNSVRLLHELNTDLYGLNLMLYSTKRTVGVPQNRRINTIGVAVQYADVDGAHAKARQQQCKSAVICKESTSLHTD